MNRDFECVNMTPENISYSPDNFDIFVHSLSGLDENETDLYYYHSDHASASLSTSLGSSSFITDATSITTQHLQINNPTYTSPERGGTMVCSKHRLKKNK